MQITVGHKGRDIIHMLLLCMFVSDDQILYGNTVELQWQWCGGQPSNAYKPIVCQWLVAQQNENEWICTFTFIHILVVHFVSYIGLCLFVCGLDQLYRIFIEYISHRCTYTHNATHIKTNIIMCICTLNICVRTVLIAIYNQFHSCEWHDCLYY